MPNELPWWQTAVIYQVYPRSFQDTDGDGIGDLPGITARLDYLVALGVDAVWISPFYPSPMADFGYDVADYTGVDPMFGTLADFDTLIAAVHARGLKLILDFVPNHSSDQHPWFRESRSSRTNPKRDWYLWHDPVPYPWLAPGQDTRPISQQHPNNWMSHFGGPAWTWDEPTQQFYCHSFLREQPDLNWRNPEVRAAIYAAMRFWLDRGVDGFRMDVLWLLIKDAEFRNNPPNPAWRLGDHSFGSVLPTYTADQPETHAIVAEMRQLMDSYGPTTSGSGGFTSTPQTLSSFAAGGGSASPITAASAAPEGTLNPRSNRVLIGEIYLPLPDLIRYYGASNQAGQGTGANLPFNFHLILTAWRADAIANIIRDYERLLPAGAWPNYVLGNHDQPRLATRIGAKQARVAAMLLLTLRGTPTLYYGDELGMEDVPIAPDQVQDPAEKNEPGKGKGRDPERSPMLWLPAPNAGFTAPTSEPWLPLSADWPTRNAATQREDPRSTLTLYRTLLALRRQHDTLHSGAIADVQSEGTLLRYRRVAIEEGSSTDFLVLLNLGPEPVVTQTPAGAVILTTILDGSGSQVEGVITVEGDEGILIAIDAASSS